MTSLSVVIPIAKEETSLGGLFADLATLPNNVEIICVCSHEEQKRDHHDAFHPNISFIVSKPGRANSMNKGAQHASGEILWFLHADSRFSPDTLRALQETIHSLPDHLLFFDLIFYDKPSKLMYLNQWGVFLRSRLLKVPFGDQGLLIKKSLFEQLGTFSDNALYGEDHLLVWAAHLNNIPVLPIHASLGTSARKYQQRGWFATTLNHQYLWIKQALPQWIRKQKNRLL